jgi:hypothetical protein
MIIVTSCNEHATYMSFAGFVGRAYRKHGFDKLVLLFVTDMTGGETVDKLRSEFPGEVILVPRIPGVDSGIQAKCCRMWYCSTLGSQLCMPVDIDTVPLNPSWLRACMVLCTTKDRIVATLGCDIYDGTPDQGKFPMPYCVGTGDAFKSVVNPRDLELSELFLTHWPEVASNPVDGKENVLGPYRSFSDESLLRLLIQTHSPGVLIPGPPPHLSRKVPGAPGDRLRELSPSADPGQTDENGVAKRTSWRDFSQQSLDAGDYIDASMPRPLSEHRELLLPLAVSLGISL